MLSAKPKFVDEAASQLTFAGPLQRPNLSPGHMSHGQMHQQITSTVGGHKRSIQATTPENEQRPSQRTCRELFSPDSAQAAPALFAQQLVDMHLPRQPPTPTLGLASSELARRQATPTQVAHPPSATTPVPSVPVADPWSLLLANSSLVLRERLSSSNLTPAATATGRQLLELEVQLQALLGVRKDEEGSGNVCWVDHGFLHYAQGVMYFHRMYGDAECAQMLTGLRLTASRWHLGPNGRHCYDEHHNFFHAQGPKGAAACLMKRLLALTRMRAQLALHQPVLGALTALVQALQQRFPEGLPGGMYTPEARPLVHQVITVQKHWCSDSGPQRADRAIHMLHAMMTNTQQLPGSSVVGLVNFLQQLLDECHPQADLVHERLGRHVQHLLKFGRDLYDPLQYNAVVADINRPLLINAGPGSGKTTVMALRALYIIGMLRQVSKSQGFDDVVALTFSRRAQQHMEQTLDGMCVRVAHNHTFDGLWLRMANDFHARLGRPAVRILGQDEVNSFLSEQIQSQMELRFRQGRCQCEPVGPEWKDLLDSISELLTHHLQQGFVKHTAVGLYSLKQVWEQNSTSTSNSSPQQQIMREVRQDPRLGAELWRCQLPLAARDLQPALQASVTALVSSLQVDDAIIWELLGHATRIWHIASGQLGPQPERVQQAADAIFNYWSSRKAWLLDEFQDVAHSQYRLLHALTCPAPATAPHGPRQRVTIVGDGDQAIYDWRGADVLLFEEQFEQDYTAVQRLAMTTNYRSTDNIVARSNALIAGNYRNPDRAGCLPKALRAARGTLCNDPVQFVRYRSKESQGQHILDSVKWWHEHGLWRDRAGVQKGPGVPYSQIRILARAKWQLYHLKGVLERGGLKPHVVLAGDNSDLAEAADEEEELANLPPSRDKLVLSSVHAVKGLECVVCFVVGLDTKAWRYLPCPVAWTDVQQTRESRNVAYVAMTRAERVLYLSHIGPPEAANSFFAEAMLPGDIVSEM